MRTVSEALQNASEQLEQAGLDDSRLEARLLLAYSLNRSTVWIFQNPEMPLAPEVDERLTSFIKQRLSGVPLAYLLGTREFYGRSFRVDARVLVPRPETETLLESALEFARDACVSNVVDVGTGSGILAISLALELPQARIWAVDRSSDALAVARQNAADQGVTTRVNFLAGDLLAPVPVQADLIVANLPYVPTDEMRRLQPEVRHEPRIALDGGPDGLDLYRRLLSQVPAVLHPSGALFLEIGDQQGAAMSRITQAALPGFQVRVQRDLEGRDRVVSATAKRE